jgi:hypothetical protein
VHSDQAPGSFIPGSSSEVYPDKAEKVKHPRSLTPCSRLHSCFWAQTDRGELSLIIERRCHTQDNDTEKGTNEETL